MTRQGVSTLDEPIPPSVMEPIWLEPYPDDLLAAEDYNPERRISERESVTLAFIAALHLLPPRQRAVLILRDVLDWQANEVADLLDMTVPAVKSALHRARATLENHASGEMAVDALDDATQQQLDDYVRAWEMADVNTLLALLKENATFSMPPNPSWYRGRDTIGGLVSKAIFSGEAPGRWRLLPTRANRQIAFGLYRRDEASNTYNPYGIQVLTFDGGLIADITTFRVPALAAHFKLPEKIEQ
jgi:RNA polymerase sigma-70 factor (ECF subfamily)